MPIKDPEARRLYNKRRNARINADPVRKAKKNADARAQYKARAADPEYRAKRAELSRVAAERMGPDKVREVQRRSNRKRYYGITDEQFTEMFKEQGGVCAICKKPPHRKRKDGNPFVLSVDHCHTTGEVRGLLCSDCNFGIGKLKHDPALLRAAIEFLSR